MTVFRLGLPGAFRRPSDAADYTRIGAEYIVDVAEDLGWDHGGLDANVTEAAEAMRNDETEVEDRTARLIAVVLAGDAAFYTAFIDWFPAYRVLARPLDWVFGRKLRRLAAMYVGAEATGVAGWLRNYPGVLDDPPTYSRPPDVPVDGRPPTAYADSFGDRVALSDAVLHTEWFAHAAAYVGVEIDRGLVERTIAESPAFFAGETQELSADVTRFQWVLFRDAAWLRDVDRLYGLGSVICREAAEDLEEARERLAPTSSDL